MEKKLTEMEYGEEGLIKEVEKGFKEKIAGMGIREGKEVKMMTKQPIKGPITINIGRANISLGMGLAEKISVEVRG